MEVRVQGENGTIVDKEDFSYVLKIDNGEYSVAPILSFYWQCLEE